MDVLSLLDSRNIPYVHKGGDEYAIECLNSASHQDGIDAKASLSINVEKLSAHCFACGFSMNQEKLTRWLLGDSLEELSLESLALRAKIKRLSEPEKSLARSSSNQILMPPGEPWKEDYRGISQDTYKRLEAIHCTRGYYNNRIVFPVYVNSRFMGVDARALSDDMQPKYLRNKGATAKTDWLYPFDLVKAHKPRLIILTEGIFDSINILDKIGPVGLCVFGTENFSTAKLRLILSTGCEEVMLFFDRDKAGQEAQHKVANLLKEWVDVSTAYLDHIEVDEKLSEMKGRLMYKDCGDLSKVELAVAIDNRSKIRDKLSYLNDKILTCRN